MEIKEYHKLRFIKNNRFDNIQNASHYLHRLLFKVNYDKLSLRNSLTMFNQHFDTFSYSSIQIAFI